jgi:hypothetical protein
VGRAFTRTAVAWEISAPGRPRCRAAGHLRHDRNNLRRSDIRAKGPRRRLAPKASNFVCSSSMNQKQLHISTQKLCIRIFSRMYERYAQILAGSDVVAFASILLKRSAELIQSA